MNINDDMQSTFNYQQAFTRNIGWLTEDEQDILRHKKVAIAGLGGVGGSHLLSLVRLGIENFHLADMDIFELSNFNRQVGATVSSINKPKIDIMSDMALNINPSLNLKKFNDGVSQENIDSFLDNVDCYIDAIDFYAIEIREKIYKRCVERHIPCVIAAPLGMSCAYLIYIPGQMTFEDYFQFNSLTNEFDKILHFIIGLNPTISCSQYLVVPHAVNLHNKQGPSLSVSCMLCTGIVGTEVLKILLNRRYIYCLPHYHLFDAYLCKYVRGWMPFGNRNPIQRVKIYFLKKKYASK